jgi:hypothetical protein
MIIPNYIYFDLPHSLKELVSLTALAQEIYPRSDCDYCDQLGLGPSQKAQARSFAIWLEENHDFYSLGTRNLPSKCSTNFTALAQDYVINLMLNSRLSGRHCNYKRNEYIRVLTPVKNSNKNNNLQ